MCKKLLSLSILTVFTLLTVNSAKAQTQFWSDTFEGAGPTSGTRTPSFSGGSGGPPNTRYFKLVTKTAGAPASIDINAPGFNLASVQGTKFWAAEDVDAAPSGVTNEQPYEQNVTWGGISIAGKTGITFTGSFATGGTTFFDHQNAATVGPDFLSMEYELNGSGTWVPFLVFQPNVFGGTNGALAVDNNGDNLGDGTAMTTSFADFSASIPVTGTTLAIRCRVSVNQLAEEVAFDNMRLFETPSCAAPTITSQPPLIRTICAGNNTTFNISATGATTFKWQVDLTGGGSYSDLSNVAPYSGVTTNTLTITGVTAGMHNYRYRCVAINGTVSCFSNSNYGTLTISNSYLLPTANQSVTKAVGNNYANNTCELINSVTATGTNPITGNVTSTVWVEGSVPTQAGLPFVQRHYEITPANNPSTATGTVTLYFSQTEFDNFNAAAGSTLDLPANTSDAAGKANLRIAKYSGVSGNGSGLPSSYSSTTLLIDPDDNNITWNTVSNAWEVTFNVDGFSGFIVQTANVILPVRWASFMVRTQENGVLINWSTASEQNTKDFTVQHRNETGAWTNLAVLTAAGNSGSLLNYSYFHASPANGNNFYQVMQTDLDGKTTFTEIKTVKVTFAQEAFTIMANPVVNGVLKVQVNKPVNLSLFSTDGKLIWKKQVAAGLLSIPIGTHMKGIYSLQSEGESRKVIIQ